MTTSTTAKTKIFWTERERQMLLRWVIDLVRKDFPQMPAADMVSVRALYPKYLQKAVDNLPVDRQRTVKQDLHAPWLAAYLRSHVDPASITERAQAVEEAQKPTEYAAPVLDLNEIIKVSVEVNLDLLIQKTTPIVYEKVMASIREEFQLIPKTPFVRPVTSLPTSAPRVHKPRIVVCGLLPIQQEEIKKHFDTKLDLRFMDNDTGGSRHHYGTAEFAVGMVSKMNHSNDESLKKHFKARYHRTSGGPDSVFRILTEIYNNANLPKIQ